MERQRMGRRKRFNLIGLLIFFNLLLSAAAEEGDVLQVRLETFPLNPIVQNPWSVYILVNYPNPLEVDVWPPNFPSLLVLERIRAETRLVDGDTRWTRVEFRFLPLMEAIVDLEPFEIRTPLGVAFTDRSRVRFGPEVYRRHYEPRFRWLYPASAVSPGDRAELTLELADWDPGRTVPEGFFSGQAPLNAIVREGLPVPVREGVYHYPISVIPLEGSNIVLGPFSFNYEVYNLDVPRISFRVLPARVGVEEDVLPNETITDNSNESMENENSFRTISFPQTQEKFFFLLQGEYNRITARARALWNEDRRAEALAELRRNERDSLCGPFLVSLRQEIEQELGIVFTGNERWRPLKLPLVFYALFFIAVIAALVFLFILRPRLLIYGKKFFLLRKSFLSVIIIILATGLGIIFLEGSIGDFPAGRSPGNTAVLKNTYSYRIPDLRGAVNEWFSDGQPVIVGDYSGEWRLAETPDGRSGWVPREAVITY